MTLFTVAKIGVPIISSCFMYGVYKVVAPDYDGFDIMFGSLLFGAAFCFNLLPYALSNAND
jgi:hypothetical protein